MIRAAVFVAIALSAIQTSTQEPRQDRIKLGKPHSDFGITTKKSQDQVAVETKAGTTIFTESR